MLVRYRITELGDPPKVQTAPDGLAGHKAHIVLTTSMEIAPDDLTIPANAHFVRGTMMHAFKYGGAVVAILGFPHDKAPNAAMVEKMGAGLALPADADAAPLTRQRDQCSETHPSRKMQETTASLFYILTGRLQRRTL